MSEELRRRAAELLLKAAKTEGGIGFFEVDGLIDQIKDALDLIIYANPKNEAYVGRLNIRDLVVEEFARLLRRGRLLPNGTKEYLRLVYCKEFIRLAHSK